MNNLKRLWEKLAKVNAKFYINSSKGRNITDEEFRLSGIEDFYKYILSDNLLKKGVCLEIGCGTGRMSEFMALYFDNLIGVDISGRMVKEARQRVKNAQFYETDGSTLPIFDETIDVVFSYLVFQHIKTLKMIKDNFKEVYRVLKPKGIFKVLLRHKKESMRKWNSGVAFDRKLLDKLCEDFKLIKTNYNEQSYTFWVWLQK